MGEQQLLDADRPATHAGASVSAPSDTRVSPTRQDIQALRGFAVLLVVLFHTGIGNFQGGYLGVDVFFVISGYLITGLIARDILQGTFRFSGFYFRRAKRLLPAAYVTLAATTLLAPWMLDQSQLHDFAAQVAGAVTYTSNIVLWQQTGYFAGASELKPLLHMWSLAVEEQFYLLLPAALVLVPRTAWWRACLVAMVASAVLCFVAVSIKPIATFYLLPTRAWELLLGSCGCLVAIAPRASHGRILLGVARWAFWPSLIVLVLVPLYPVAGPHPGASAALVCVATLIVILHRAPLLERSALFRPLARVGDMSYSLYLVHWPIICFAGNAWIGERANGQLPMDVRLGLLVLSVLTAYVLYRYVEDPIRRKSVMLTPRLWVSFSAASIGLLAVTPLAVALAPQRVDYDDLRRPNYGFDVACETRGAYRPLPQCRSSDSPEFLVWGDSLAMHLVPGLSSEVDARGIVQATRSSCAPILGLAYREPVYPGRGLVRDSSWAGQCLEFNRAVITRLAQEPSIRTVVLSARLDNLLVADNSEHVVESEASGYRAFPVDADRVVLGFKRTVDALHALGKKVVLVAPPPSTTFDIGKCVERRLTGKLRFGEPQDCTISVEDYREVRAAELRVLARLPNEASLPVIGFDDALCGPSTCDTTLDGRLLYRDKEHFSYDGSRALLNEVHLARQIDAQAR